MPLQTHLIGSRIPMQLYTQVEAYAGSRYTVGDVVRLALERLVSTASTKPTVIRSNTDNLNSSLADLIKNKQPKERSDDFAV